MHTLVCVYNYAYALNVTLTVYYAFYILYDTRMYHM